MDWIGVRESGKPCAVRPQERTRPYCTQSKPIVIRGILTLNSLSLTGGLGTSGETTCSNWVKMGRTRGWGCAPSGVQGAPRLQPTPWSHEAEGPPGEYLPVCVLARLSQACILPFFSIHLSYFCLIYVCILHTPHPLAVRTCTVV